MRGASAKRMWLSTSARIWLGFVVGEAETAADVRGHGDPHLHMAVKADAVGSFAKGGRLADIVQKRAPSEGRRAAGLQFFEKQEGMDPDVALGMELRRLLDALHPCDFRQNLDEEAGFVEQFEGAAGVAFGEHPGELVANAFAADRMDRAASCRMAASVAGSMSKPKRAAKRTARSSRS